MDEVKRLPVTIRVGHLEKQVGFIHVVPGKDGPKVLAEFLQAVADELLQHTDD